MGRRDRASGDRASGQTERQTRADAARLRRRRCRNRGHADGGDGRKNSECLLHDLLLRISA
ncbi:hypothetical protein [Bradyrhizobium sp. CCBAU 53338]|uniref:hypothetical protein n=1 Tax=Bradyrhizobium sp. CCBAU 53338 TaxID=1325111 RepID=UPI00352E872E